MINMEKEDIITIFRAKRDEVKEKFDAELLAIYGSYARGSQTPDSDLDVLYHLPPGSRFGLLELDGLEAYIKELIDVPSVDLVNEKYVNPIIEMEIQNELVYV